MMTREQAARHKAEVDNRTHDPVDCGFCIMTANYVKELRPDEPNPSCHVCGCIMIATSWRCLSCGTTTRPTGDQLVALAVGNPAEGLFVYGTEEATRIVQDLLTKAEKNKHL